MMFAKLRNKKGVSLLEMMIALLLTGILATASFQFYNSMSSSTLGQQDLTDLQHICRVSASEIKKNLRMAGYKTGTHDPYAISGDTLTVYCSGVQPIDTIRYFLGSQKAYGRAGNETARKSYTLMRQTNAEEAQPMSDDLCALTFNIIDSANVEFTVEAESSRIDHDYTPNDGYRKFSLTERVKIRNIR